MLCSACARDYYPVYEEVTFDECQINSESIDLEYALTKLNDEGAYTRKARGKNLHFIQVKLTNNSDCDLYISRNKLNVYTDYSLTPLLGKEQVQHKLKQRPGYYLFWLLMAFSSANYYRDEVVINPYGAGLGALGSSFGIYNYVKGRKANKALYQNFMPRSLLTQSVPPGKTAEGWICLTSKKPLENIMIKFNDKK